MMTWDVPGGAYDDAEYDVDEDDEDDEDDDDDKDDEDDEDYEDDKDNDDDVHQQSSIKCGVSSQRNLCHFFGL